MLKPTPGTFVDLIGKNAVNRAILARLPALDIPDAWLVAGCLFQTIWNINSERPAMEGINDYDLFYFDDRDLSIEAEDVVVQKATAVFRDLGVKVDVKNQARVHLWFHDHFGYSCPTLTSSKAGIDRFLVACTCVGVHARRPSR